MVMKFMLTVNPRDGMTLDQFNYEWGVIHPSLMITTPSVMRGFERYAQHRRARGATDEHYQYGRHPQDWYGMSDHWLPSLDALFAIFQAADYPRRMGDHDFGNGSFVLELVEGEVLHDQPVPFTGRGGVKLVNFIARDPLLEQHAFARRWRTDYAPAVVKLAGHGRLLRYAQSTQLPLDATLFEGSLFAAGGVQTYAGIEELWFADLDQLRAWHDEREQDTAVTDAAQGLIDPQASFSLVVVERVLWDYTTATPPPRPAVEDPQSLEARLVAGEFEPGEWDRVRKVSQQR
ncbi:EthD domain-containing protein [Nocardia sp. CA-135398]|uniref:EthD domain-containing protein n=1 Tax=Nocardia sp. CA-135398 TaxID=3239977 RepID=UPI003D99FB0C